MSWIEELPAEQRAALLQIRLQAAMLLPEGEREPHLRELLAQSSNGNAQATAERAVVGAGLALSGGKGAASSAPIREINRLKQPRLTRDQYIAMRNEAEDLFARGFHIDEAYRRIMAVPGRSGFAQKSLYRWFKAWELTQAKPAPQGEMFMPAEIMLPPTDARD